MQQRTHEKGITSARPIATEMSAQSALRPVPTADPVPSKIRDATIPAVIAFGFSTESTWACLMMVAMIPKPRRITASPRVQGRIFQ